MSATRSRELRAELESLQSEVAAVRVAIRATESRIPGAFSRAESAREELCVARAPLDALSEEHRALEEQIHWENPQARPSAWGPFFFAVMVLIMAVTACMDLSHR